MTPRNSRDDELRQREQALKDREHAIRLRELEAELRQPAQSPVYPTHKHEESKPVKQRLKQMLEVAKFLGLIVAVVVALQFGVWLAQVAMIGALAFVAYKLFFTGDRKR